MKVFKAITASVITIVVLLGLSVAMPTPSQVSALTPQEEACMAIGNDKSCNDTTTGNSNGDLTSIVKLIVNIISVLVGVAAVTMLMWGGMKYITSGGDTNKAKSAKDTIVYALIGLVIVALSQFVVKYVLATATNASISCATGQHAVSGKCVANKP